MKHPLIIANWKLNGKIKKIKRAIKNLINTLNHSNHCTVAIAPPLIYLMMVKKLLRKKKIEICAQNVDVHLSGPHTGDISAEMLKDIGVKYAIIGHSERRIFHNESDDFIALKFKTVKSQGLIPILCIGESKEENKKGITKDVCIRQINAVLKKINIDLFKNTVIAYEPIWAIGKNEPPSSNYVQSIHKFIRNYFKKINPIISEKIIIQYGGSINLNNAFDFLTQPDIDGLLIGRESMNIKNFSSIINSI